MIDAYSVPCAPETSASTGPGLAPWKTTTGIEAAASTPAGTSRVPVAFCPGAAVAVPTVKVFCASMPAEQRTVINNRQKVRLSFIAEQYKPLPQKVVGILVRISCARIGALYSFRCSGGHAHEGIHDGLPAYAAGYPGAHSKNLPCRGNRLPSARWQHAPLYLPGFLSPCQGAGGSAASRRLAAGRS